MSSNNSNTPVLGKSSTDNQKNWFNICQLQNIPLWEKDVNCTSEEHMSLTFKRMNEPALKLFSFNNYDDAVGKGDHEIRSEIQRFSNFCVDGDKRVILKI